VSCKERINTFDKKVAKMGENLIDNKIELESYKSIFNLLNIFFKLGHYHLLKSQITLCRLSKKNLKICNGISNFCNSYQRN